MMNQTEQVRKRRLRDLYHYSPLVWAVVKGYGDAETIADRLEKPQESIERGIREALRAGILRRRLGILVPVNPQHFALYHKLNIPVTTHPRTHPVFKFLDDHEALSTQVIADHLGRSYNSTYKTLQRLERQGQLERVGKAWRQV